MNTIFSDLMKVCGYTLTQTDTKVSSYRKEIKKELRKLLSEDDSTTEYWTDDFTWIVIEVNKADQKHFYPNATMAYVFKYGGPTRPDDWYFIATFVFPKDVTEPELKKLLRRINEKAKNDKTKL